MTAADPRPTYVALLGVAGHGIGALADALGGEDERAAHGVRAVTVRANDRPFRVVHGGDHGDVLRVLLQQEPVPHAAVPVASTEIGVTVGLREQLFVASRLGVPVPAAVLTGGGAAFEFVERSLRVRLAECGYPADDVPVLPAEANGEWLASLKAVPDPGSIRDRQHLIMGAHEVDFLQGKGTIVRGSVEQGRCRIGDAVEVIGGAERLSAVIVAFEMLNPPLPADLMSVLLSAIDRQRVFPGQVLASPGTIRAATAFEAVVHLRPADDGSSRSPMASGDRGLLHLRNSHRLARWTLLDGPGALAPGEVGGVRIDLPAESALAVYPGLAFGVREGGRTVGWGRVTRVVE